MKRFKVYLKTTLLVALAMVVAAVVYQNRANRVDVWFFADFADINVLWLITYTAAGTLVSWWIVVASRGVIREMGELSREAQRQSVERQQQAMAAKLAETEKRIDSKLKKAVSDETAD